MGLAEVLQKRIKARKDESDDEVVQENDPLAGASRSSTTSTEYTEVDGENDIQDGVRSLNSFIFTVFIVIIVEKRRQQPNRRRRHRFNLLRCPRQSPRNPREAQTTRRPWARDSLSTARKATPRPCRLRSPRTQSRQKRYPRLLPLLETRPHRALL